MTIHFTLQIQYQLFLKSCISIEKGNKMENFLLIALSIFLGYVIQHWNIFTKQAPIVLNQFVIYISLPAMVLLQIINLQFSIDILIPVVIAYATMFSCAVLVWLFSKIFSFSTEVTAALLLVAVWGNTSFLGIPLVEAYFGKEGLPYVIVYDQFGSFLSLSLFAGFIISYHSGASAITLKEVFRKIMKFPPFLALLVAFVFLFMKVEYPVAVKQTLEALSQTIVPLALVAVGLQLKLKLPRQEVTPLLLALFTKLVFSPVVALVIAGIFFGFFHESSQKLSVQVSIFEAGMAPMITAGALATVANIAVRLSSAIVGYGIVLSFLTTAILFSFL